jgi:hypothetical protein
VGGAEVTTGLGVGDGPENVSGRNSAALTSSDNSVNTAREGEDGHTIVSYRRRQSRFGLIPKRSMESTRSRSPKRPVSLTTNTMACGIGKGDEAPMSREDGREINPKEPEDPWTPYDEEVHGCSISDDDHFSGLQVFPEERATTKPEPLWISDTSPTATTSIRCTIDPIANHPHTRPPTSTTDQAQRHDGLSNSTPPESRVPPQNPIPSPRYRSLHRRRAETHRDPCRDRVFG